MNVDDTSFRKEFCGCFKDESRFVELPCWVGDNVYWAVGTGTNNPHVRCGEVTAITVSAPCIRDAERGKEYSVWTEVKFAGETETYLYDDGYHFFTYEEAEKKLEEMKNA